MGGRHQHRQDVTRGDRRTALAVVGVVLVVVAGAMALLWPGSPARSLPDAGAVQVTGEVLAVTGSACPSGSEPAAPQAPAAPENQPAPENPSAPACGSADVRLDSGAQSGRQVRVPLPSGAGAPVVEPGQHVVVLHTAGNPQGQQYQVIDHERGLQLWVLVAAFALAIVAFGRWRGAMALLGLAVTFSVLMVFVIPAILQGRPPLLVAIIGSAAIALTVLYLTHGPTWATTVAVVGTLASLTLTGLLAWAAVVATRLSGFADETAANLGQLYGVNLQGLLLAGILLGSLGVLDDVTVTQAATVQELAAADHRMGFGRLYRAATRVGRAHIASVVNTIVLAYAGAALPLLVLVTALDDPVGQVLSDQLIATEIVRSAVGTLGLIAAVPITTALAARWAVQRRR